MRHAAQVALRSSCPRCRHGLKSLIGIALLAWGLVTLLGSIAAAQPAPDGAENAAAFRARADALRRDADLTAEQQDRIAELLEQSAVAAERLAALQQERATLTAEVGRAPAELADLRARLQAPLPTAPDVAAEAARLRGGEVERRLREREAELVTRNGELRQLEDQLAARRRRPEVIVGLLREASERLPQIERELDAPSPEGELPALTQARRDALTVRRRLRQAEIAALEAELAAQDTLLAVLSTRRDLRLREVVSLEERVRAWRDTARGQLQVEAARRVAQARETERRLVDAPAGLTALAQHDRELAERHAQLAAKLRGLERRLEAEETRLAELEADHETVSQRIELVGLNETIGRILRTQRAFLPDLRSYRHDARSRQEEMSAIAMARLDMEQRRRELADLSAVVETVLSSLAVPAEELERHRSTAEGLLREELDLLQTLEASQDGYFKMLARLDGAQRRLVEAAERHAALIDRHLLWIRSHAPLRVTEPAELLTSARWFFEPAHGRELAAAIRAVPRAAPGLALSLLVAAVAVAWWSRSRKAGLEEIAKLVGKTRTDAFSLTLRALAETVVLALRGPAVLAALAWLLQAAADDSAPFARALSGALLSVAFVWSLLSLLRGLAAPHGLARAHFGWDAAAGQELCSSLAWFMALYLPFALAVFATERLADQTPNVAVGRLAFVAAMIVLALFLGRLLRPRGPLATALGRRCPDGAFARLRPVAFVLAAALPVAMAVLASLGYYDTSLQVEARIELTIWALLGLLLVAALLLRSLRLTHRRLQWHRARTEREDRQELRQGSAASESVVLPVEVEEETALDDISEDARRLLGNVAIFAAVLILWVLWAGLLPALQVLDEVALWHATDVINGIETQVPVTLAGVGLALLVGLLTLTAGRRLPGALEFAVLRRTRMDAGARHAVSTLCQHAITAIGLVVAFNALGARWSSLQWLIAALSVGLGFGLQEIVANFISGIIILFERPFRVGDIVTVNGQTGVVARIRIRATTIVDWERRELIVPNKQFITGELVNATLSDSVARILIPVGVAYGCDVERAKALVREIAEAHEEVLTDPAPSCYFVGFGDSALLLEVRAFIGDVRNRLRVSDALHGEINRVLAEAGIEIVFPQRDVNLKTARPVEVQLVGRPATDDEETPQDVRD
jgi:potassium efflux system protein